MEERESTKGNKLQHKRNEISIWFKAAQNKTKQMWAVSNFQWGQNPEMKHN